MRGKRKAGGGRSSPTSTTTTTTKTITTTTKKKITHKPSEHSHKTQHLFLLVRSPIQRMILLLIRTNLLRLIGWGKMGKGKNRR